MGGEGETIENIKSIEEIYLGGEGETIEKLSGRGRERFFAYNFAEWVKLLTFATDGFIKQEQ